MLHYFQILTAFVAVFLALYYYFISRFDFWKNHGVIGPKPIPLFGNAKDVLLRKIGIGSFITELYQKYENERMFGIFIGKLPNLVLRDLDLIKDVLIKDFSIFDNRGLNVLERADPFSVNIFTINAKRWRPLRARLSPVFTSGKLKEMFPLILECAEHLEQCLEDIVKKGEPVDFYEISERYTIDVIGSCAFGINMNALSDESSEFRKMGKSIFDQNIIKFMRNFLRDFFPRFYNLLGFVLPYAKSIVFMTKLIKETIKYREDNNVTRLDFVNSLMDLKKHPEKLKNIEITDTFLAAQASIFFAAGFETSTAAMAHFLYEMALNPSMQDKLRKELKEFHVKNNGNLKYEDIKEMKYFDKVFKETLRKYPPGMILRRECNTNYTFRGTKVTIPVGTVVIIPLYGIQIDPKFYENPDVFDPERFNDDAVAARHPMSYMPFGDGPRNCIGARFAVYQTKLGLIKMLQDFRVDICERTMIPYVKKTNSLMFTPKDGIFLKIEKIID